MEAIEAIEAIEANWCPKCEWGAVHPNDAHEGSFVPCLILPGVTLAAWQSVLAVIEAARGVADKRNRQEARTKEILEIAAAAKRGDPTAKDRLRAIDSGEVFDFGTLVDELAERVRTLPSSVRGGR